MTTVLMYLLIVWVCLGIIYILYTLISSIITDIRFDRQIESIKETLSNLDKTNTEQENEQ